ncbi:hypothetical protein FKM82_029756 [Ascaphus truei]
MEHTTQLTSQSSDIEQQTDMVESQPVANHELDQETVLNEEQVAHSETVLEDQHPVVEGEGHPSVNQESSLEKEEPSSVQQQSSADQEIVYQVLQPLDMEKTALQEPQSNTNDQEQSSLVLDQELVIIESQSAGNTFAKQIGYQINQESVTEQQERAKQDPSAADEEDVEKFLSLMEEEQTIAEEHNDNQKQGFEDEAELENNLSPDVTNATATVKVMLVPDGQVVTMAFSIGYSVESLKKYFASQLKIPEAVIRIMFEGRAVEDLKTLVDLGVTPHGTIQLEMFSLDPENYPIKAIKLQHEYSMPDVITVRVQTGEEPCQDLVVEIERLNYRKPYLGGYRHKVTGAVFHHAGTQTAPKKKPDKGIVVFCRDTQTVTEKKKLQQCRNAMSTQMTKIGCYVANLTDKLLEPKQYVTAEEYHARRRNAVIVIQTYLRRFHARTVVQQLREQRRLRLEWEEKEELRKRKEKEDRLRRDFERRMNPKTKEDFELLYHALELWRLEEVDRINQSYTGAERKAALCALLEQETQLIASIGRHKIDADEENQQTAIQFLLNKCCEPKRWKAFDGRTTEMYTQYTIRARELRDIYASINTKYFNDDERLDALLTLKLTVQVSFVFLNGFHDVAMYFVSLLICHSLSSVNIINV